MNHITPTWRFPASSPQFGDKNPFRSVTKVVSMANLQEWNHSDSKDRSTTAMSSSSWDAISNNQQATSAVSHEESRTPTPKNKPAQEFSSPVSMPVSSPPTSPSVFGSMNPWARVMEMRNLSPSPSEESEYSAVPSPESTSRSDTPIAPQPMRPFIANAELIPGREKPPIVMPFAPFPALGTNNPYYENAEDSLEPQPITSELVQKQHRRILSLVQRQSWTAQTKKLVFQWTLQHPRTALLLWMANDIEAWPKAFWQGLEDSQLPYTLEALEGKASEPAWVEQLQWKVAFKQLEQEGKHTEFAVTEMVPLKVAGELPSSAVSSKAAHTAKRLDLVTFSDTAVESSAGKVFVRKRLDVKTKADKDAILSKLKDFHTLSHPHLERIAASYARGQTVAFLTLKCETNLSDFLELFATPSEADQLLTWMTDLASAVSYLHTCDIPHRSIRPSKILINPVSQRITLAPFGIAPRPLGSTPGALDRFSTDPAYIYAAPEVLAVVPRAVSDSEALAADVWSLGCVFLEMCTAARGTTLEKLASHLCSASHDASYAVNRSRALAWAELMRSQAPSGRSASTGRRAKTQAQVGHVLMAVLGMLAERGEERPDMRRVVSFLESGRESGKRKGVREDIRGVLEGVPREGVWGDLESLNGYYSR